MMNFSLLAEWRWMLLVEERPLWKRILEDKYGSMVGNVGEAGGGLVQIGSNKQKWGGRLEVGMGITFEMICWCQVCVTFPSLFPISNHKDIKVGEFWQSRYVTGLGVFLA